jgi:hypothetical protein
MEDNNTPKSADLGGVVMMAVVPIVVYVVAVLLLPSVGRGFHGFGSRTRCSEPTKLPRMARPYFVGRADVPPRF